MNSCQFFRNSNYFQMQSKQQEFLKQREKLKHVTKNTIAKKALDPDIMIEQLISDKETFKFNEKPPLPFAVPEWLKIESNLVPAVYEQVWQAVKLGPAFQYCDTIVITHLFTTSGLSFEKLGYLWSLTNVSLPGFLTRQELYIMLALIALVQTGYQVRDICILNSINHPILPQLDYSFLNVTVANPTINGRNNDLKCVPSMLYNGFNSVSPSNSVVHGKPLSDPASSNQLPKNTSAFLSSPLDAESLKNDLPLNVEFVKNSFLSNEPTPRKSEIGVSFTIPELNQTNVALNFASKAPVPELKVDSPIPPFRMEPKPAPPKPRTNFSVAAEPQKVDSDVSLKHTNFSNFLDANLLTNGLDPRSLDLFTFNKPVADEDEFTEFQSATVPVINENFDFQCVLPIVEYELQNSAAKKLHPSFNSNIKYVLPNSTTAKLSPPINSIVVNEIHNSIHEKLPSVFDSNASIMSKVETKEVFKDDLLDYTTSTERDKYDVFRALMEPSEEEKYQTADHCNENDEEDEEFGDFNAADIKHELSIKDKCLEACLRLLQEGLQIFSSVSNEKTIIEVLSDERGYRYFYQLKIIYDTSQRFQRQVESTHLNDTVQSTWAKLFEYTKYISNEDLLDEMPSEDDFDATPCKLCEIKCDVNCVRYAGHNYHVTCINLFLHFVEDSKISAILNV